MKLRCGVALAVIGWYALVPTMPNGKVDPTAPLSRWYIGAAFDRADECEASRRVTMKEAVKHLSTDKGWVKSLDMGAA